MSYAFVSGWRILAIPQLASNLMARRTSNAELLVRLFSSMPPWLAFSLAAVSYLILHWIAGWETVSATTIEGLTGVIYSQFLHVGATIGQYVLPVVLGLGGVIGWFKRRDAGRLADDFGESRLDPADMTWKQFESLVGEIYRRQGYSSTETAGGADGGIDLVLRRGSERYLVQCKHWRARQVGVKVVRELKGVIATSEATGGSVVTSGRFSREAIEFARQAGIELVDGNALRSRTVRVEPVMESHPNCPMCDSVMVERVARRGARAGQAFWGCSRFPECSGTAEISGNVGSLAN